jgi:glycosyltransferase involved in cell wall biosynthesis
MFSGGLRTKGITKQTQKNQPLITVVTVVRNGEETLEETILSVINQTYKNVEYIIVDGASNDGTLEIIKKYEDRIDYWISKPDKGIFDAMNKGIALATGEYIALLNSDDWYEKNTCEIIANKIIEVKADIYYGMMRVINNKDGSLIFIYGFTDQILQRYMIAHPTCFIKKDVYRLYQYDIKYKTAADYDFIIRLKKNNYKFVFIECIIANYKLGGMSDSKLGQIETNNILWKYRMINPIKYLCKNIYLHFFS